MPLLVVIALFILLREFIRISICQRNMNGYSHETLKT